VAVQKVILWILTWTKALIFVRVVMVMTPIIWCPMSGMYMRE